MTVRTVVAAAEYVVHREQIVPVGERDVDWTERRFQHLVPRVPPSIREIARERRSWIFERRQDPGECPPVANIDRSGENATEVSIGNAHVIEGIFPCRGAVPALVKSNCFRRISSQICSLAPPLRVLLTPSAYYPHVGGIEELTRQLALALAARGHEVAVLTNQWPEGVLPSETLDGIDVTRLRFPLPAARTLSAAQFAAAAPLAIAALLRDIRRRRPDVVHVIGAGPQATYLAFLHSRLRAPLIFTAQGELSFDAHDVFAHSRSLRAGLRQMLRHADTVTACSAYVMRELERFGRSSAPHVVVPNGVNPSDFDGARAPDEAGYVLAVGRLVRQKGFDLLIEAFASDALSGSKLVLAGDGTERRRLETQVSDLGIASRVGFLGSIGRSQLPQLLAGAAVFVLPSRGEPFGIALLEAMAAGVPAVATAAGGVPEFARDGENALLVPPEDAPALAAAVSRIEKDVELGRRLSLGGRKTAAELTWSRIAAQYEALYCMKGTSGGGS